MGDLLFRVYSYFIHIFKRKDEHFLHSPFLFNFYTTIFLNKEKYLLDHIEKERDLLLSNSDIITTLNSSKSGFKNIKIKDKARASLSPAIQSCFLGALVSYSKPKYLLEIGTSFGISGAYLASYAKDGMVLTLEGNPVIESLARQLFFKSKLNNIKIVGGDFDDTITCINRYLPELDLVFFDGNHTYEATLRYFNYCLKFINNNSIFIFHDIYWSRGMNRAWKEIKSHSSITLSLDVYFFGIVFFRDNQPKQDFFLKF